MGGGRPGFMSPTNSSVAKSPRASYPQHAVTTNGAKLVAHDRWPAAAPTTQPAVKSTQKPMLRKHSSSKNEQTSYADMQRKKQEAHRRAEVLHEAQRRQTHQDHLRGSGLMAAPPSPAPAPAADAALPIAGADVRQRRAERRQGAEHGAISASWTGDGHTPRKGGMYGVNAPLPRAEAGAGRAGEVLPHADKQRPRASAEPDERPACRKIVTGVPRELTTSVEHPLLDTTPTVAATAPAGSGQLGHASAPSNATPVEPAMPSTPSSAIRDAPRTPSAAGAHEPQPLAAGSAEISPVVRRGGTPRTGRVAGEEGFDPHVRTGRRRPSAKEVARVSPVHPTRGGGKGHHPNPAHHRWSATNASPISQRNVLTHAGINIDDGHDTPMATLQHHSSQHVSCRKIPAPDTSKQGRDARQLGHHVPIVGSDLLQSQATAPPPPEAGHDAKPGRRQQRHGGHGHSIAHEMHPDGAGSRSLPKQGIERGDHVTTTRRAVSSYGRALHASTEGILG